MTVGKHGMERTPRPYIKKAMQWAGAERRQGGRYLRIAYGNKSRPPETKEIVKYPSEVGKEPPILQCTERISVEKMCYEYVMTTNLMMMMMMIVLV